jgi:hypothetical protein
MRTLVWISLLPNLAMASDFDSRVQSIKDRSLQIENLIGGFTGSSSRARKNQTDSESESLFKVHNSISQRAAGIGEIAFGKLHTKILVGTEPVPAIVRFNSNQGRFSGLRAIGLARANSVEGRVSISISKLILSSGKALSINAQTLDAQGAQGLKAEVISHRALAVAGALGSSFVSGLAAASQTQKTNAFGFTETQPTGRNAILQGLAQTAADQSKWLIDEATKEKPVLVLEPGTDVSILFEEELLL